MENPLAKNGQNGIFYRHKPKNDVNCENLEVFEIYGKTLKWQKTPKIEAYSIIWHLFKISGKKPLKK